MLSSSQRLALDFKNQSSHGEFGLYQKMVYGYHLEAVPKHFLLHLLKLTSNQNLGCFQVRATIRTESALDGQY